MSIEQADNVIQTMVEFQQLSTIMEAATTSTAKAQWTRKLRKLAKGVAFVTEEDERPSTRDIQFECYLAAVLSLSGWPTAFAEPDVIITHNGSKIGFAAKRPRSERSLERKLRLGARQIQTSGLPGIVAVDLSGVLPRGVCVMPPDREASIKFVEDAVDAFVKREWSRIFTLVGNRATAVLLCLQLPTLIGVPDAPQPAQDCLASSASVISGRRH